LVIELIRLLLTRILKEGIGGIIEERWPRRAYNYKCVNKETDETNGRLKNMF